MSNGAKNARGAGAETPQAAHTQAGSPVRAGADMRARSNAPVSVRLGATLLERLDRFAEQEHRTRGNLIQHVLWEYVRAREAH